MPLLRSLMRFHWLTLLLVILVASSASTEAEAKKAKKQPQYYGSFTGSGQWQQTSSCGGTYYNFQSKWQMEGLYARTTLEETNELELSVGGASGGIDWSVDEVCNGNVQSGNCSVGLDEKDFVLPVILWKAKGGLRVDFQLSLIGIGCGYAQVSPYGQGFEVFQPAPSREPEGFIPFKKIGKKVIRVPISGFGSGTAGQGSRTFSGQMSGTLTLTRKKPIQILPD